jgi:hypothetical protein
MLGGGAQVAVRRGRLVIRGLSPIPAVREGLVLHPDDPDDPSAFRLDLSRFGFGTSRMVFRGTPDGRETAMHLGLAPISLRRRRGRAGGYSIRPLR